MSRKITPRFSLKPLYAPVCMAITTLLASPASAQLMLEEVVVTAQKRTESLSDVPISVNVVGADKLANSGITNLLDMSDFVPNLSMNQTGLGTNITVRGISSGINPAFEQSVGMYMDDIYYGRAQLSRAPYLDIARVEVLRGPQPILFGKNAIAGAISMITERATTDEVTGFVQADYNFDQNGKDFQGAVNVPLTDEFAIRLAGLSRESDGYYKNTNLNRDESALDEQVLRVNLQWEPADDMSFNVKYEQSEYDTEGRFLEIINPVEVNGSPSFADAIAALTGGSVILDTEQDYKRQANGDIEETEVENLTARFEWDLDAFTLNVIASEVEYDYFQQCDCDFINAILIDTAGYEEFEQTSYEVRLTSPGGETIDWIAGAFKQEYDVTVNDMTIVPVGSLLGGLSALLPGTAARRAYETDSELWSVFAQFTWNINDEMRLTVGGRYTEEDKTGARSIDIVEVQGLSPIRDVLGQVASTNAGLGATYAAGFGIDNELVNLSGGTDCGGATDSTGHNLACDRDESKFTPAVNFQWDATPDMMVYASYTEGFKAGGFDTRANNTGSFEFDEEEATSYEIGTKMSALDGAAEINVAIYLTEYDNLQTSQFDGILGFNVTNAGQATTSGIEIDGRWQAAESLMVTFSAGYLDFEFDEFPNSQCFFGETPNGGPAFPGLCNREGERREFTPEITANLGGEYYFDIGSQMEGTVGVDLIYSDDYFVSPTLDPNLEQGSYVKMNARFELASNEGDWSVSLLLENITDEEVLTFGNQAPVSTTLSNSFNSATGAPGVATAYYGFYGAPFNVALQARYNF